MMDRGIARQGHAIYANGEPVGAVTSGTQTPFLKKAIGLGLRADCACRERDRARDRYPRPAAPCPGRADCRFTKTDKVDGPYPAGLKYTKDHEWFELSGDQGKVGITDFAQQQLGDVVYLELPDVGTAVKVGQSFGNDRIGEGRLRAVRARVAAKLWR